jgi:hypothetical protein
MNSRRGNIRDAIGILQTEAHRVSHSPAKGKLMTPSQAAREFIASAFATATIALALASSAHAADYSGSRAASASAACERARQFAIFRRQMERTDGDVSPALPAAQPSECRVTQAANDPDVMRSSASEAKDAAAPARRGYGEGSGNAR